MTSRWRALSYSTAGMLLEPRPVTPGSPPIWVRSWGSGAGLRRVARHADGWLASAYNTTPELFAEARQKLHGELAGVGKDPDTFPNTLATMSFSVTEDAAEAEQGPQRGSRSPDWAETPEELRVAGVRRLGGAARTRRPRRSRPRAPGAATAGS